MIPKKSLQWILLRFYLPYRQRRGIFTLTLLLLGLQGLHFYWWTQAPNKQVHTSAAFGSQINGFVGQLQRADRAKSQHQGQKFEAELHQRYARLKLFAFDPNTASPQQLQQLGLSEKQARIVENYRKKGGQFRTKADFGKLYGLPPQQYTLLEAYIQLPDDRRSSPPKTAQAQTKTTTLFPFDPNTLSADSFQLLGFSPRQVASIVSARNKGLRFRSDTDFSKVYVVAPEQYARLQPYIRIASTPPTSKTEAPKGRIEPIELNTATAEQLTALPGIGEYTAGLLVKYRDRLGGYVHLDQLSEIEKLRPEQLQRFAQWLRIDPQGVQGIALNTAPAGQLRYHPYIGYQKAVLIVRRREQYGYFKQIDQLLTEGIFQANELERLRPYLRLK